MLCVKVAMLAFFLRQVSRPFFANLAKAGSSSSLANSSIQQTRGRPSTMRFTRWKRYIVSGARTMS